MVIYLSWFHCFPYGLKNVERNRLGLEPMHVTAKLTVIPGFSVQVKKKGKAIPVTGHEDP
jgi:hypothetical protein